MSQMLKCLERRANFSFREKLVNFNLKKDFALESSKMEKLSEVPTKDTDITPQEKSVIQKFFGSPPPPSGQKSPSAMSWTMALKLAGYGALLFLALANPWVDSIFSSLLTSVSESPLILLGVKTLLFALSFCVLIKFCI